MIKLGLLPFDPAVDKKMSFFPSICYKPNDHSIVFSQNWKSSEEDYSHKATRFIFWDYLNNQISIKSQSSPEGENFYQISKFFNGKTNDFYFFNREEPPPAGDRTTPMHYKPRKLLKLEFEDQIKKEGSLQVRNVTPPEMGFCLPPGQTIFTESGDMLYIPAFSFRGTIQAVHLESGNTSEFSCLPHFAEYSKLNLLPTDLNSGSSEHTRDLTKEDSRKEKTCHSHSGLKGHTLYAVTLAWCSYDSEREVILGLAIDKLASKIYLMRSGGGQEEQVLWDLDVDFSNITHGNITLNVNDQFYANGKQLFQLFTNRI